MEHAVDRDTCEWSIQLLQEGALQLRLELDETRSARFIEYCRLIHATNQVMNLTALRTPSQIMSGLFLSSLAMIPALPDEFTGRDAVVNAVDVGSGSGIPGIPLKILFPTWSLATIEATQKKASFISDVVDVLGLDRVRVLAERAEVLGGNSEFRDRAHLCLARAVATLPTLIELCSPLVAPGGLMAFAKGPDVDAEVHSARAAARALNATLESVVHSSPLPGTIPGTVVLYRKSAATPSGFPRRTGLARSRPIGI